MLTFAPAFKAKFLLKSGKLNHKKSQQRFAGNGKGLYLCPPQMRLDLIAGKAKKDQKFFIRKLARNKISFYLCTPQDREFIERLAGRFGRRGNVKISKKKLQKKLAGLEKEFYFCTRFLKHGNGN